MTVVVVAWAPVLEPSDWIRYAAASVVALKLVVDDVREMNENARLRNRQVDGYDPSDCFMTRAKTATMMMLLAVSCMYRGSWIYQIRQAR